MLILTKIILGPFNYYVIRHGEEGGVCQNMIMYYAGEGGGKFDQI